MEPFVIDRFFRDPVSVRQWAVCQSFEGAVGPSDGVVYPDISTAVPASVLLETQRQVSFYCGPIELKHCFFRLTRAGTKPPHWAHTDLEIADALAVVYLTAPEHCQGGTAILEHVTGMRTHPETSDELDLWRRDTNDESKWRVIQCPKMMFNRAVVYPTNVFHAAMPREGFGHGPADGRLVYIAFFNRRT